jgi:hypothetical protein
MGALSSVDGKVSGGRALNRLRKVMLEFLRHGPPHNQLISPLTQYLALCGNHPTVTVRVPLEHAQFLARLEALSYQSTVIGQVLQLRETATVMREILSQVPGLIAELAKAPGLDAQGGGAGSDQEDFTHLELVLPASELALLPFELADAPHGFPGTGQSLALQPQSPVCITRRTRRLDDRNVRWNRPPRILFIEAAPRRSVPSQAHVLALINALNPWVSKAGASGSLASIYQGVLTIINDANVDKIQRECAVGGYTHVHILAHGVEYAEGVDKRFGLQLFDAKDPSQTDVVSGVRLAGLLRSYTNTGGYGLSSPLVVTIAACEGGQGGSVVGAGASVAHALHEAGIPLVLASQFPLSIGGSVVMAEVFYKGLLEGHDPRLLLNKLRWQLHAIFPDKHDWASLVAYASLPADLEGQLSEFRIMQARHSIQTAFDEYDRAVQVRYAQ